MAKVLALVVLFLSGCGANQVKPSIAADAGKMCSDSSERQGECQPPDSAYSVVEMRV